MGSDGVKWGQVGSGGGHVGSSGVITGQLRIVAYSCAVYLQPFFKVPLTSYLKQPFIVFT